MDLIVRPARLSDRPSVLAISRGIWEGHDYVPLFFERWVRRGGMFVGETRGRLVGWGKMTELARGELWLEGLRIDPKLQGRGLGTELSRRILAIALDRRPASLRLSTADVNQSSIRIIEMMRFKRVATYRFLLGHPGKPRPGPGIVRPSPSEAFEFIRMTDGFGQGRGLLPYTWLFREVTATHLRELCRAGFVFGYCRGAVLAGLLVMRPHRYHPRDLDISFAAGSKPALVAFRSFIARVAAEQKSTNVSGMAASPAMASALAGFGLSPHPHVSEVMVYEYPI